MPESISKLSPLEYRRFGSIFFKISLRNLLSECEANKCVDLEKCKSTRLLMLNEAYMRLVSDEALRLSIDKSLLLAMRRTLSDKLNSCCIDMLYTDTCSEIIDEEIPLSGSPFEYGDMVVMVISFASPENASDDGKDI